MKKTLFLVAVFAAFTVWQSCLYEKIDHTAVVTCDTVAVSYNKTIKPIMTTHCNTGGDCHNAVSVAAGGGSGYNFENYADIKSTVAGSTIMSDAMLQNGKASRMPRGAAKLDDCTINQFLAWVRQGAKEN